MRPEESVAAVTVLIITTIAGFAADKPEAMSAEAAFKKAVAFAEKQQYQQAIPYLERVRKELPNDSSVLWNLGIARSEIGDHRQALEVWKNYRKVSPDDWKARPKLIQEYQAIGDKKGRDVEIKSLYKLRGNSSDSALKSADQFCREQCVIAGRKVFAFESFSPQGPRKKFFRFSVVDKKGFEEFYLSLGSYDDTTEIAREVGEIGKNERVYHLDEYRKDEHKNYAFFGRNLTYDELRPIVVDVLQGKREPISRSSRGRIFLRP